MFVDALIPSRFRRYVALGDSFTEGVGDPDPNRPNGVRGWADRVAEAMAADVPDFGYANLAIRGRKLPAIIAGQVEPALALRPDLVTIHGGGNDVLRPKVDLDALAAAYAASTPSPRRTPLPCVGCAVVARRWSCSPSPTRVSIR